jgi:4-hydroxybenzoate polyprenyltransferase
MRGGARNHPADPGMTAAQAASSTSRAALRIVFEVVAFRVRRLEMANLAGALAIMLVLGLPWGEVGVRLLFAGLLNVLVYLNNDFHDVALDAGSPDKDPDKAAFLMAHRRAAVLAQWVLGALLAALAFAWSTGLVLVLIAGVGICFLYSFKLKHTPFLDIAAMALWGFAMPLSGSPLDSALGVVLAAQLGLFSAVFEALQVIRDHDADARQGVRTTAVVLGVPRTLRLSRLLMLACALYAALALHPIAGAVAACAALLPLSDGRADRLWTRVKLVYGVAFLIGCALAYGHGQSAGLWLAFERDAALPALRAVR